MSVRDSDGVGVDFVRSGILSVKQQQILNGVGVAAGEDSTQKAIWVEKHNPSTDYSHIQGWVSAFGVKIPGLSWR